MVESDVALLAFNLMPYAISFVVVYAIMELIGFMPNKTEKGFYRSGIRGKISDREAVIWVVIAGFAAAFFERIVLSQILAKFPENIDRNFILLGIIILIVLFPHLLRLVRKST